MGVSPYRAMWLIAMFDLPVGTHAQLKHYTRFRKALLRDGFMMMQFSVYARYCASEEASQTHRERIRKALPPEGEVRILILTDHQFGKMLVYRGEKRTEPEAGPVQLDMF